ncbi:MAG TPA: slipin family protein [Planctomycetota bacterium]|nr:slipin family protein [Planctomycetota bacterium]
MTIDPTLYAQYLTATTTSHRRSLLPTWRQVIDVPAYYCALLYRDGRFIERLASGRYRRWGQGWKADLYDLRPRQVVIAGQELLTADRNPVKVSALMSFTIADPLRLSAAAQAPEQALYHAAQLALREAVATTALDALLEKAAELAPRLDAALVPVAEALGYIQVHLAIRDLMVSPELKRAFAAVVTARQEGLAALERARGEHASLRSLANAARLLDEQPSLAQLKTLQVLGDALAKGGSTIVIGDNALTLRPTAKGGGHAT